MIHSLRFIEENWKKILQARTCELFLCSDWQNVDACDIWKWKAIDLVDLSNNQ